jgi:hypothetical protein
MKFPALVVWSVRSDQPDALRPSHACNAYTPNLGAASGLPALILPLLLLFFLYHLLLDPELITV